MNALLLKELERYTYNDLKDMFNVDEEKLHKILNKLYDMNIVKKITKDISKSDLEELLSIEDIDKFDILFEETNYLFNYVGLIVIEGKFLIIYPKYVFNYKEDINSNFSVLKQLIKVITNFQFRYQRLGLGDETEYEYFNILSMGLEVINNYHEFGLYSNNKNFIEENGDGEVLWEKTINEKDMYLVDGTPIYFDTYTISQLNDERDYFRRLNTFVISDICEKFKEIFNIIGIESIQVSNEIESSFGSKNYIIHRINQELSKQYITYKQHILKTIRNYIDNNAEQKASDRVLLVGTTNFKRIWEDVCKIVLDDKLNIKLKEIKLPKELSSEYYENDKLINVIEKPLWTINDVDYKADTLIPDIISVYKDKDKEFKFIIFDPKYYNIRLEKKKILGQPGIESITKQYLYQLAYKSFIEKHGFKENSIKNCFLFPTTDDNVRKLGVVRMVMLDEIGLENIHIISLPAQKVYDLYLQNKKLDIEELDLFNN